MKLGEHLFGGMTMTRSQFEASLIRAGYTREAARLIALDTQGTFDPPEEQPPEFAGWGFPYYYGQEVPPKSKPSYANPDEWDDEHIDPLWFCGDME